MAKVQIYTEIADALSKKAAIQRTNRLANRVQDDARYRLTVNRNVVTGDLVRSIKIRMRNTRYKVTATVGSHLSYAMVVHQGARPHLIRPRRRKGLKFEWPAGVGNPPLLKPTMVCFKGVVHHPGFRSNRYLLIPLVIEAPRLGFYATPLV
jgi:hypothetical protein